MANGRKHFESLDDEHSSLLDNSKKNNNFDNDDDEVAKKSSCCIKYTGKAIKFTINELDSFISAGTGTIFFAELVPNAPQPYDFFIKFGAFAASYVLQDTISNFKFLLSSNMEDVKFSNSDFRKAERKALIAFAAGFIFLAGMGTLSFFNLQKLIAQLPDRLASDNGAIRGFAEALSYALENRDAILAPVLGAFGYLSYRASTGLVRAVADRIRISQSLEVSFELSNYTYYQVGQMGFNAIKSVFVEETVSCYLSCFGQGLLAANPLMQLGVMFTADYVFQGVDYLNKPEDKHNFLDYAHRGKIEKRIASFLTSLLVQGAKFGLGYGVFYLFDQYFNALQDDTPLNRSTKLAVSGFVGGLFALTVNKITHCQEERELARGFSHDI